MESVPGNGRFETEEGHEALQDLAQLLIHRLGGALSTIEGYTDMLNDTLGSTDQREMAIRILESTGYMEKILKDLRRFCNSNDPIRGTVSVKGFSQTLGMLLPKAERERVLVFCEEDVQLMADEVLLRQAVIACIQNGLDASPGAVMLHIATRPAGVTFSVTNEGAIAPDVDRDRLFQPFYTTKTQNLGIGLCLARRIARAHGGDAKLVYSTRERGTCFAISLPTPPADAV